MNRKLSLLFSSLLALGLLSFACSPGETVVDTGNGGSGTNPGTAGTGTTGAAGTGTTSGRGGNTGTAGTNTTGTAGTTGSAGRGGNTGTAGTTGSAGTGTTGTAGRGTGTAGTTGTAGVSGTAGTSGTTTCSAWNVASDGFVTAPVNGGNCWSGYASAGGDAGSTITPMNFMACATPCMLKVTGMVGPATAANSYAGFVYLGFNVGQAAGGSTATTVMPTAGATGIKVAFANTSATTTLRVQLVGDAAGSLIWCNTVTGASPVSIPYAMFTKACYNTPPGAAYNKEPIMSVQLNIPGEATAKTVALTLTSVTEY